MSCSAQIACASFAWMSEQRAKASLGALTAHGMAMCETRSGNIEGPLFPEELTIVANAVPSRVEEFRLGRAAARKALAQLGVQAGPIGVGQSRAPLWPAGIVGSISHTTGFCGSVVGSTSDYRAIGIDACVNERLFDGAIDRIASPDERVWVDASTSAELATDALVFSIKETVFKLWSPLTGVWLGFDEAEVTVDLASGSYLATIQAKDRVAGAKFPETVEGRFTYDGSIILNLSCLKV